MEDFKDIKRIRLIRFGSCDAKLITLRVQRPGAADICYIFDRKLPLLKLLEDYCKLENLDYSAMRFLYNGLMVIRADKCADDLRMKNGDTIGVIILMDEFEDIINYKRIQLLHFGRSAVNPIKLMIVRGLVGKADDYCYIFQRKLTLRQFLEDYCKLENIDYDAVSFIYNGRMIREDLRADDSPDMEYGDTIEAFHYQIAGTPKLVEDYEDIKWIGLLHSGSNPIKLIVQRRHGEAEADSCYIVDRKLLLRKLLEVYCKLENLDYGNMAFIYNGCMVREYECADALEMENGDIIDAFVQRF